MDRAVVLLSGGLDSCVASAIARETRDVYALGVVYGQRHACELEAARQIANVLEIPLHLVRADVASIVGSALLGSCSVSKGRTREQIVSDVAPTTFVPARNALFLALASAFATSIGAQEVWVGSNADDGVGYPDCRDEFFDAFETMSKVGGFEVRIMRPLVRMTKRQVVLHGRSILAPIELSWSCYSPVGGEGHEVPCEQCDACVLRAEAMR